jgi:hypothetical protein
MKFDQQYLIQVSLTKRIRSKMSEFGGERWGQTGTTFLLRVQLIHFVQITHENLQLNLASHS